MIFTKGKFSFPVGNNHSLLSLQTLSSHFVIRIIAHSVNNAQLKHSTNNPHNILHYLLRFLYWNGERKSSHCTPPLYNTHNTNAKSFTLIYHMKWSSTIINSRLEEKIFIMSSIYLNQLYRINILLLLVVRC